MWRRRCRRRRRLRCCCSPSGAVRGTSWSGASVRAAGCGCASVASAGSPGNASLVVDCSGRLSGSGGMIDMDRTVAHGTVASNASAEPERRKRIFREGETDGVGSRVCVPRLRAGSDKDGSSRSRPAPAGPCLDNRISASYRLTSQIDQSNEASCARFNHRRRKPVCPNFWMPWSEGKRSSSRGMGGRWRIWFRHRPTTGIACVVRSTGSPPCAGRSSPFPWKSCGHGGTRDTNTDVCGRCFRHGELVLPR